MYCRYWNDGSAFGENRHREGERDTREGGEIARFGGHWGTYLGSCVGYRPNDILELCNVCANSHDIRRFVMYTPR